MLNKDRITLQEQQIIWDNKLMNNGIRLKLAEDEQRSLLLHALGDQKATLRTLLTQWKLASIKMDPLNIGTDHRFEDMIASLSTIGSQKPILKELSSYQQTATAQIWKSKNHVMVIETVRIPLQYQSFPLLKYTPVTLAINGTLLTPILQRHFVALDNGHSRELDRKDL